jgi:hypothetical protein
MRTRKVHREKCLAQGKDIFATKEDARAYLLTEFRARHAGHGTTYRCSFGDHYHVSKGLTGRKGKDLR